MRFGPVAVAEAEGAVLAHSLAAGGLKLRKGRMLSAGDLAALQAAGVAEVTVARLEPGDVAEDAAAEALAAALAPDPAAAGLRLTAPFTGRVNLVALADGVLRVDRGAVDALNGGDPAITLATLPDRARVRAGQMVATVKIIPYGVAGAELARAVRRLAAACAAPIRLHRFRPGRATLILTTTPGLKPSLIASGAAAIGARLAALGQEMAPPVIVPHATAAVAAAIVEAEGGLVLILGASATSDAGDTCPAGLVAAGGRLVRFGMPVDPGNLLFLGEQAGRPVVGLPGCARSPALNGADWVLERLAAGLTVTGAEIAGMGVGGLLKEIAARPQPRAGRTRPAGPPQVAALVLAAGAARRMRGRDKLLEEVGGRPVLRAVAEAALASSAGAGRRRPAARRSRPGPGARGARGRDRRGARLGRGDGRLAARRARRRRRPRRRGGGPARRHARDRRRRDRPADRRLRPGRGRARSCARSAPTAGPATRCSSAAASSRTCAASPATRARASVLAAAADFVVEVPTAGDAALVDLDTPEDWAAWRAARA